MLSSSAEFVVFPCGRDEVVADSTWPVSSKQACLCSSLLILVPPSSWAIRRTLGHVATLPQHLVSRSGTMQTLSLRRHSSARNEGSKGRRTRE